MASKLIKNISNNNWRQTINNCLKNIPHERGWNFVKNTNKQFANCNITQQLFEIIKPHPSHSQYIFFKSHIDPTIRFFAKV
jgi:hypothetical protein